MDEINAHIRSLLDCCCCALMQGKPVCHKAIDSRILLVGQAPGPREESFGKFFAWTAGKTLFSWFREYASVGEDDFRDKVFIAAVCRCFPGKASGGGDRVPDRQEIENCSVWLREELSILRPQLIIPVGKLAIAQFITPQKLDEMIGQKFSAEHPQEARRCDVIPLPHPSGASPWHRKEAGKKLIQQAMKKIVAHPAWLETFNHPPR